MVCIWFCTPARSLYSSPFLGSHGVVPIRLWFELLSLSLSFRLRDPPCFRCFDCLTFIPLPLLSNRSLSEHPYEYAVISCILSPVQRSFVCALGFPHMTSFDL